MDDIDVDAIIDQLTLSEKCSLLGGEDVWHTTSIRRLSIPSLCLSDGANTARGNNFFNSTPTICLPCGPALAATWDRQLLREIGNLLADECKAKGIHIILGPCVNIARSPLGGRVNEAFGEDPFLSGVMSGFYCQGLQERDIIATPKHFVCADQEQDRFAMNCIVTERALREIYLLPFMLTIKIGDPGALMTSYNKINGTHSTESKHLLKEVLREEWGFRGAVMSDWHGMYSVSEPVIAGVDLEMPGPARLRDKNLGFAVGAAQVSLETLDARVRTVLNMIKEASRANIPERAPETILDRPEDRALLRRAAADSIVCLKNNHQILPLDKSKPIAVIGPNARLSAYRGGRIALLRPYRTVTPLEAIEESSQSTVHFTQGAFNHKERPLLGHQMKTSNGTTGFEMRFYNDPPDVSDRECLERFEFLNSDGFFFNYPNSDKLKSELWYADIEGWFTPAESGEFEFGVCVQGTANLYVDGELVVDNTTNQTLGTSFFNNGTIEEIGTLVVEAGRTYHVQCRWASPVTSKVIKPPSLMFCPGGVRIGASPRLNTQESIFAAAKLAREVEQVVVCSGLMGEWEQEGNDRRDFGLPPHNDEMISAILAANPNAVICISSGSPVAMPWVDEANALLQIWYGGNETGGALADVLFGDVNPSGKLSMTFPKQLRDTPTYLCSQTERGNVHYGEGVFVGYRYYDIMEKDVLFPFGHGLSYTNFTLSGLNVLVDEEAGSATVSVTVENTGSFKGAETVQIYISQECPTVKRPLRELKGFEKVTLDVGEKQRVNVEMELKYVTAFWDESKHQWICEKGRYDVFLGRSSRDNFLNASFTLEKTKLWSGL